MDVVERHYLEYIQTQTAIMGQARHTDVNAQLLYQLGFLQAQLARAMARDSLVVDCFKSTIKRNGLTKLR